jgi:hypothetical protein
MAVKNLHVLLDSTDLEDEELTKAINIPIHFGINILRSLYSFFI